MSKVAVDFFSGTGSATKAFRESNDWKVFDVELNPSNDFDSDRIDLEKDIMDVNPEDLPNQVDFVWASPPCTAFSRASVGHHWSENMKPDTEYCLTNIQLVWKTLYLINKLKPDYWFMENPQGMLINVLPHSPEKVTYCQYGDDRMKPTYLYGQHPSSMQYRSCSEGDKCHEAAPRGSNHSGTQNTDMNATDRAQIPYGLSKKIFEAVENPGKKIKQEKLEKVRPQNEC